MFLFSQVFLKNIGLRCRTFIIKNRTFAAHLLVAACDVLDLSVLFAYWDGYTFSKRSFFKDVYFANYSCLLFFFLLTVVRVDYSHYVKMSWYSRHIIVNVSWQNYFLTSVIDHMQPHISRCGHTLEINTFILVNLISYEKIYKLCFTLKFKSYLKNKKVNFIFDYCGKCDHVTLMPKLRPLSSKLVLQILVF